MINIWGTTFLVGPFLGPALAGYLADAMNWRDAFAVLVGCYSVSTALVFVFGKETYYAPDCGPAPAPGFVQSITSRGGALHLYRPSLYLSAKTTLRYIFKWPMLLCGMYLSESNTLFCFSMFF
jgi:MFS family permease